MQILCVDCSTLFQRPKPQGRIPTLCLDCRKKRSNAVSRRWYDANQERVVATRRASHARRTREDFRAATLKKFGLTPEQYDAMLETQGGVCAICGGIDEHIDRRTNAPRALSVDHCHETGRVRGLLCGPCNRALGLLRDNADLATAAGEYLRAR